jgi:hypothetical protein
MPKPDVIPLTDDYRRTPIAQIGADVFCDISPNPRRGNTLHDPADPLGLPLGTAFAMTDHQIPERQGTPVEIASAGWSPARTHGLGRLERNFPTPAISPAPIRSLKRVKSGGQSEMRWSE